MTIVNDPVEWEPTRMLKMKMAMRNIFKKFLEICLHDVTLSNSVLSTLLTPGIYFKFSLSPFLNTWDAKLFFYEDNCNKIPTVSTIVKHWSPIPKSPIQGTGSDNKI